MSSLAIAALVDADGLIESSVAALIAGAGVAIAFSCAVYGAARFADSRRVGSPLGGGAAIGLAAVAVLVCAATIVAGLVIMISDRT